MECRIIERVVGFPELELAPAGYDFTKWVATVTVYPLGFDEDTGRKFLSPSINANVSFRSNSSADEMEKWAEVFKVASLIAKRQLDLLDGNVRKEALAMWNRVDELLGKRK